RADSPRSAMFCTSVVKRPGGRSLFPATENDSRNPAISGLGTRDQFGIHQADGTPGCCQYIALRRNSQLPALCVSDIRSVDRQFLGRTAAVRLKTYSRFPVAH